MGKHDENRKRIRGACLELLREGQNLTTLAVRDRLGGGGSGVIQEVIKEVESDIRQWYSLLAGKTSWVGTVRDLFDQLIQESISQAGSIFSEEKAELQGDAFQARAELADAENHIRTLQEQLNHLQTEHGTLSGTHGALLVEHARTQEQLNDVRARLQESSQEAIRLREDLQRRDFKLNDLAAQKAQADGRVEQLLSDRKTMEAALGQSERARIEAEILASQLREKLAKHEQPDA